MSRCDCSDCEAWRDRDRKEDLHQRKLNELTFKRIFTSVATWIAMSEAFKRGYIKGKIDGRKQLREWQNDTKMF